MTSSVRAFLTRAGAALSLRGLTEPVSIHRSTILDTVWYERFTSCAIFLMLLFSKYRSNNYVPDFIRYSPTLPNKHVHVIFLSKNLLYSCYTDTSELNNLKIEFEFRASVQTSEFKVDFLSTAPNYELWKCNYEHS